MHPRLLADTESVRTAECPASDGARPNSSPRAFTGRAAPKERLVDSTGVPAPRPTACGPQALLRVGRSVVVHRLTLRLALSVRRHLLGLVGRRPQGGGCRRGEDAGISKVRATSHGT